jgi:hypothetical protein
MLNKPMFWISQMVFLVAVYLFAAFKLLQGDSSHIVVLIAGLLLAAHALEIPLAYRMLKDRAPSFARLLPLTLLFGLIWWVPARRGIFKVK